jgi:E3 ubiquitin-protein ligase CCNP1IP1
MDKIIHDANGEISNLRNKMSSTHFYMDFEKNPLLICAADMQVDQDSLRRKNEELIQALREKSRKHLQTQELYDKLKRRAMLGQVQNAASDAVEQNIQASVTASRFVDQVNNQNQNQRPPPPPLFSNQQTSGIQNPGMVSGSGPVGGAQIGRSGPGEDTWAGFGSQGSIQRMFDPLLCASLSHFIAREPTYPDPFHPPSAVGFWQSARSSHWTGQPSRKQRPWSLGTTA